MTSVLGFVLGNWQRAALYAALAAAVLGTFWTWCFMKGREALHEYKAAQATEAVRVIRRIEVVKELVAQVGADM